MIGQMLMIGFRGLTITPQEPIYAEIQAGRCGNVVLFNYDVPNASPVRNIESSQQLTALNRSLQALAPLPMLIAADQEGGLVARLRPANGFPETLSHEELAALKDLGQTRSRAQAMATTLRANGINLNLAPVVDVNVNPQNPVIGDIGRSFSADPEVVAHQALAFIEGHHAQGVLTTLKHFPGHGSSRDDSHLGFVDVTDTWSRDELVPYRRLIQAGLADSVMTAHIFNERLDSRYPATLSRPTITGILRDELGFDGVIITDDMQMGAIRDHYGFEESVELAVLAGCDMIAIANNGIYDPNVSRRAFDTIRRAVQAGRISSARIDQSYRRIMRLKQRLTW
jgi:beta-N-acetylhexosaminidase